MTDLVARGRAIERAQAEPPSRRLDAALSAVRSYAEAEHKLRMFVDLHTSFAVETSILDAKHQIRHANG